MGVQAKILEMTCEGGIARSPKQVSKSMQIYKPTDTGPRKASWKVAFSQLDFRVKRSTSCHAYNPLVLATASELQIAGDLKGQIIALSAIQQRML
jgi:hypothetical protein